MRQNNDIVSLSSEKEAYVFDFSRQFFEKKLSYNNKKQFSFLG